VDRVDKGREGEGEEEPSGGVGKSPRGEKKWKKSGVQRGCVVGTVN